MVCIDRLESSTIGFHNSFQSQVSFHPSTFSQIFYGLDSEAPTTFGTMSNRNTPNPHAKASFKAGPHASFKSSKPVAIPKGKAESESESSGDDEVVQQKKPDAAMEEDDEDEDEEDNGLFPTMEVTTSKKKKSAVPNSRSPIVYTRKDTDAPFHVNGMLFFKNFGTLTFAISATDAEAINQDLVENFGCDKEKPLVKFDAGSGAWMLRGKPQGMMAMCLDDIAVKRAYGIQFNIGEWANLQTQESGVSAQIVGLLDKDGNSVVKVNVKFPQGGTYSAGRLISREEATEMARNGGKP